MYTLSGSEQLEEQAKIPSIEAGAPMPSLVADEQNLTLEYFSSEDKKVKINIINTSIHMFGFPNDEVIQSHPLYSSGLKWYSVYEVKNSGWIDELEKMNSVHDRHDRARFMEGKHHYIFTFHDSTFECIAMGLEVISVTKE